VTATFSKAGLLKRKYALTVFLALFGAVIAVKSGASLGDWTMFAMGLLGTFGGLDVADKKLNGGAYDESPKAG
jgi:hypothetical protein